MGEDPGLRIHQFDRWEMGRYTRLRNLKYLLYPSALASQVRWAVCDAQRDGDSEAGYDVIFAQHTISAVAAGRVRRRIGGKLVLNFLDYLTGFMEAWPAVFTRTGFVRALNRYEMSIPTRFGADGILTVSEPLAERFMAQGFPRDRILPLLYGYDSAAFRPPAEPPPEGPPLILMHGSFDKHHLGPIARDAVAYIHERRPDARFRFVGRETPNLVAFEAAIRRRCPGISIECPGFVQYANVARMLPEATVGIVPYEESQGAHCAFVAKAVEFLACGVVVASTPLENLTRHFAAEQAIRFSGFTARSFAERVLDWLETPREQRLALGRAAAARVAAELDWGTLARKAVDFAERIHQSPPRPAPGGTAATHR